MCSLCFFFFLCFCFQAEDGIRDLVRSRGLGDVYKRQTKELAEEFDLSEEKFILKLNDIRKKLFSHRKNRVHPHKDDKILTDWNALMISAFAKAAQAFNNTTYADAATKAYSFAEKYLTDKDRKLSHRFREGESGLPAHILSLIHISEPTRPY